ncbi:hypothetical protein GCM10020367_46030 [Streptomyces sannanensis]|uniref:Uncharacterized protein n=1 Tax=Streptomyces sannanensis TaxID=285536 RepID=A0ABP6SG54_9ACTN
MPERAYAGASHRSAGGILFNLIHELPGRRHTEDERRRLELTRVDLGTDDPDRGP